MSYQTKSTANVAFLKYGTLAVVSMLLTLVGLTSLLLACDASAETGSWPSKPSMRRLFTTPERAIPISSTLVTSSHDLATNDQGKPAMTAEPISADGYSITGFHSTSFSILETPIHHPSHDDKVTSQNPSKFRAIPKSTVEDAMSVYQLLAALPDGVDPGSSELGGLTLPPGIYKSSSGAFTISGADLVLDAQGVTEAMWVFQMTKSLEVGLPGAPCSVILRHGADAKNIFWQVGTVATLNDAGGGIMAGTIIANAGINFTTSGNFEVNTADGRANGQFTASAIHESASTGATVLDPLQPGMSTALLRNGLVSADQLLVDPD